MRQAYVDQWPSPDTELPQMQWREGSFRRILVAFDGSENSWKALRMGISLAWQHDAELWALSVEEDLPRFPVTIGEVQGEKDREDRYFGELHEKARMLAEGRGVKLNCAITPGRVVETITHYARQGNFDLIVIGSTSPGLWKAFLGTSSRVSRRASSNVMVVR